MSNPGLTHLRSKQVDEGEVASLSLSSEFVDILELDVPLMFPFLVSYKYPS